MSSLLPGNAVALLKRKGGELREKIHEDITVRNEELVIKGLDVEVGKREVPSRRFDGTTVAVVVHLRIVRTSHTVTRTADRA